MIDKLPQLKNHSKLGMTDQEKLAMRESMLLRMKHKNPIQSKPVERIQFQWLQVGWQAQFAQALFLSILLVSVTAGGAYASSNALPTNELFYYFKIDIKEKIEARLKPNAEARAEFHQTQIERRVKEAAVVAAKGELEPKIATVIQETIEQHTQAAENQLAKIIEPQVQKDTAEDLVVALEVSSEALKAIGDETEGAVDIEPLVETTEESAKFITEEVVQRITEAEIEESEISEENIKQLVDDKLTEVESQLAQLSSLVSYVNFSDLDDTEELPEEPIENIIEQGVPGDTDDVSETADLVDDNKNQEEVVESTKTETLEIEQEEYDLNSKISTEASEDTGEQVVDTGKKQLADQDEEALNESTESEQTAEVEEALGIDDEAAQESVELKEEPEEPEKAEDEVDYEAILTSVSSLYDQALSEIADNDFTTALETLREAYRIAEEALRIFDIKETLQAEKDKQEDSEPTKEKIIDSSTSSVDSKQENSEQVVDEDLSNSAAQEEDSAVVPEKAIEVSDSEGFVSS